MVLIASHKCKSLCRLGGLGILSQEFLDVLALFFFVRRKRISKKLSVYINLRQSTLAIGQGTFLTKSRRNRHMGAYLRKLISFIKS